MEKQTTTLGNLSRENISRLNGIVDSLKNLRPGEIDKVLEAFLEVLRPYQMDMLEYVA